MKFYEQLIHFQNQAEKDFQQHKTAGSTFRYVLAFASFLMSSMIAGLTMPIRMLTRKKHLEGGIVEVSESNIEEILSQHKLVLLDFWAEWCGPCIMMSDTLKTFAHSQELVLVGKINADRNADLLKKYFVKGLPQFILIYYGKEIKRHAGAMTLTELEKFTEVQSNS